MTSQDLDMLYAATLAAARAAQRWARRHEQGDGLPGYSKNFAQDYLDLADQLLGEAEKLSAAGAQEPGYLDMTDCTDPQKILANWKAV